MIPKNVIKACNKLMYLNSNKPIEFQMNEMVIKKINKIIICDKLFLYTNEHRSKTANYSK